MNRNPFAFVVQATEETLNNWGLADTVSSHTVASRVADGAAYWERALPDGSHLAVIRLFSPVVQREEVFLGNVLLNDFLSKALMRAVEQGGLGRMALLANDLENYYYLYHGEAALDQMAERFWQEILSSLPNLYFGDEDPARGIHGKLERMFTFEKSDFEPFPVYSVPHFLAKPLEQGVRRQIQRLLSEEDFDKNARKAMAALSFFYGQTSGGLGDAQSFAMFLYRLVDVYRVLPAETVARVFGIKEVTKNEIKDKIDAGQFSREDLRNLLGELLAYFQAEIEQGKDEWLLGFIRKDRKLIEITPEEFLSEALTGVQMGYASPAVPVVVEGEVGCRLCGVRFPRVRDRFITLGVNVFRFHNESAKKSDRKDDPNTCAKCALSAYLQQRVLGSGPAPLGGKLPQLPRLYNLLFHYGHHDEAGAQRLAAVIDYLFDRIGSFQQRAREEKKPFSVEYMREELARWERERQAAEPRSAGEIPSAEEAFAALIADDTVAPGLETLGQMRTDVQAQVLPLGVGDYRLLAFILPQLQPGRDEALDFVQRRFSRSRLAAFTLLALLRKLCGCDGPYYFQSVPTLAPGGFDANTFYVQGKAENADEAIRHFSAIANFARRVVKRQEGHSLLADWILLAERLQEDPLGTFSEVLRDSPLRVGDDLREARYRRLSNEFAKGMGVIDGTEYLKLIEQLKQL
ncbi:hypothetical protein EDD75_0883 [Thermodesulfitimonas autotrophica]|uniref:Uncharacterized protein n=1 Tax=Thermodesulfitimonas autotrophica TaxID=1894989 RepID=A0A3N5ANW1_9THEO|nr:hypothetical protein [Thermodesulfitimonas autotrophica]RPF46633.1 hypothetical protein EDD75_0883 [Thermodesulfitimonas autotrophica]